MLKYADRAIALAAVVIALGSLGLSALAYGYISQSDLAKIRLEKSADFCMRLVTDPTLNDIYKDMRSNDIFNKVKNKQIAASDTRAIGDYLNFLNYAAIMVDALKIKEDDQAIYIFSSCGCQSFYNAKHYYRTAVDQSQYPILNQLLSDDSFWIKSASCRPKWQSQP